MNIAVLVKWVPEPQGTPTLGDDRLLVREGADGALDPGDEYGLERALQLVERDGGEVIAVSMGPDVAVAAVQRALAMGAARGVLVTDDALRGADTLVTARVLAAAIRSLGADRPRRRRGGVDRRLHGHAADHRGASCSACRA